MSSNNNNISDYTGEMLTPEEFADRMNICRTIVYEMMTDNRLRAGRHYILLNSKKRFPWGADLIRKLLEDSVDFGIRNKGRNNPKSIKKKSTAGITESHEQSMKTKSKNLPYINLN
jgi:hypothetical protein